MGSNEVLIGAVTSRRHEKYLDRWLDGVSKFTHPNHLVLVDTTVGTKSYYNKLKKRGVDVLRYDWKTKEKNCFEMMADTKNMMRDKLLENGYTHFFGFDTDEFIPPESLSRLVSHDKDNVGFPTPMWHKEPCVFKEGGFIAHKDGTFKLAHYNWGELFKLCEKEQSNLLKVFAVGNGCLLSKKKVFEKLKWASPHFPLIAEDTLFYINLEKQGFESWVDMSTLPLHLPIGWQNVPSWKEDQLFGKKMVIAHGWVNDEKDREITAHGAGFPCKATA